MSVKNISVHELLSHLRQYFQESNFTKKYSNEPPPLRAELYNTTQMEQHARALAKTHKVNRSRTSDFLIKRLAGNEKILLEVRNLLSEAIKEKITISPAAEWLLDNFYLIEEQIRTGKRHFPKGYSDGLPKLLNGPSTGLPRVYDIALEIVSHSDGRIDNDLLRCFVKAYQEITELELGELWAIPIMLRLALIENLRRVSTRIAIDRINQNLADYWSDQMIKTAEKDPKSLILVIADMARSGPPMESSFVAELIRRLMWKGQALTLPLTWMEQRLSESGLTSAELVSTENQKQAADQVSISNSIGSLRFISAMEWRKFVESMSIVEQTLRSNPGDIYESMDFSTRDHYRHVVERISKHSPSTEKEVAEIAIALAKENSEKRGQQDRHSHVGYYLIDHGLKETEARSGLSLSLYWKVRKFISNYPLFNYLGSIAFIITVLSGISVYNGFLHHIDSAWIILAGVLSLLGTSQLSITLINWVATMMVRPSLLARLDFSEGIPDEYRTLVAVPTLLSSPDGVESLVESLEIRFLANRANNISYALLTDFTDARQETMPMDTVLTDLAVKKIAALNEKYKADKDIFFLFHRPRVWNNSDKVWMGYERKRGKLAALNALLSHGEKDKFSIVEGDLSVLTGVKYVITLDTDTQFPREAAWKMIATMAHPLNRPLYNNQKLRVTEGYAILQPRVAISLSRSAGTLYNQMHASDAGIDPYTRLTSDVYQDVFDEGSFIGKGIYDINTFELALNDRFPENRILSHDLLEGCYARAGLISDVQLYEEYPSLYSTDVSRRHRWIRGDWQIAWWFLPMVPSARKKFERNTLSGLSRWKIFDNLRRSLVPLALMLILLLGWTVFKAPLFYTLSVLAVIILPSVVSALWNMLNPPKEIAYRHHVASIVENLGSSLVQNIYALVCLPFEAYYSVDAILRTSWRMLVSHKHLLEWKASTLIEKKKTDSVAASYLEMWISPFIAVAAAVCEAVYYPASLIINIPILALWAGAPLVNWWISRPPKKEGSQITAEQTTFLRRISRKTWGFFEQFVVESDNFLPPDNYQEEPKEAIAHRTSPTNLGLALLSNLAANDFGYISVRSVTQRTAATMGTMNKMERFRGHFYNWYDTMTLAPLAPRYISTVDSGNLAGHLLTLRQGLIALPDQPIFGVKYYQGLRDTADIVASYFPAEPLVKNLQDYLAQIDTKAPLNLNTVRQQLEWMSETSGQILNKANSEENAQNLWASLLKNQCNELLETVLSLAPWLTLAQPAGMAQFEVMNNIPSLAQIEQLHVTVLQDVSFGKGAGTTADEIAWVEKFKEAIETAGNNARELISTIEHLDDLCNEMADMEYDFLYDHAKHLLTIGYNVDADRRDAGSYDLLASEARLCNFVAIAQDKLPQESWFSLGRLLTNDSGTPILLSWSGSMFEYLMPNLVMPDYENTLLNQTNKAVVARQIEYGNQRGVPWGISESGYNMVDANFNYQYRAFGVPGLGLKRGLSDDLVIAPYASVMSLMVAPYEACTNLQRISADGFEGKYGFYEAIDYTPSRIPRGQNSALVASFMVHHQGMGFLSLAYLLLDQPMQKRFEAELQFQATLLLLQERVPKATIPYSHTTDIAEVIIPTSNTEMRIVTATNTSIPEIQLLSNGRYNAMVTNCGGGYSRWKNIAVTRWREDATRDNWGIFCYIRDTENNTFWSNAFQPTTKVAKSYEATFSQGRAEFRRMDNNIETHTDVVVSPEDDIELRRIRLTNRSRRRRTIEITTYAEVVMANADTDISHPAFSNLFVQTEIKDNQNAIVCTRRPRFAEEQVPWMCHLVKAHGIKFDEVSYETDRMKFTGRSNGTDAPDAMTRQTTLSGSQGSVLDPIVAIRYRFTMEPGATGTFDVIMGMADNEEGINAIVDKYQEKHHTDRVLELAWTHSQVVLRQINATESDAQIYNRLARSVVFVNPNMRAEPSVLLNNRKGQSGLWSYSISGDLPIVLLRIKDQSNILLAKQMVQAHAYWRLKGLSVDLVIWNEDHGGYRQNMYDELSGIIATEGGISVTDKPGGIFIRNADQVTSEDMVLFQTVARVIIDDEKGSLLDQIRRRSPAKTPIPLLTQSQPIVVSSAAVKMPEDLLFFNGTGGFAKDGREYVIITTRKQVTPSPWSNIIANPNFGTVISESGQAYTWVENAHEQRLSPWNNDPVSDTGGEHFYLRDEDTGYVWSPSPLPAKGDSPYITRHGFGYSVFEHIENGIHSELTIFVDIEKSIKFSTIKLRNDSGQDQKISVTGFIEWVLGEHRSKSTMHVVTENNSALGTLFARNPYNSEFGEKVAFFSLDDAGSRTFTCDRAEFIGRNGSFRYPDAMTRTRLSGKSGAGLDPCAAIQYVFDLAEGQEKEISFRLGAANNMSEAEQLIREFKGMEPVADSFKRVTDYWKHTLGNIQVTTPDPALNILSNGWLMYQTLACRLWARSGYYQSGGAFGFRDQLQDVLAVMYTETTLARKQILLSASRQFREGDVQHWWHPPTGRGVRTRCSDDYLWLPYVTAYYLVHTGDTGILDEQVSFLEGRLLNEGEESYYDLPMKSADNATLYEHCIRAVKHGLRFGVNGLPLFGSGDWNDGMDMVGREGKGESVWLAFFLYDVLRKFVNIATARNDHEFADQCTREAATLKENINKNAWDGEWYRRGYFDNGTPLGSKENPECSTDSISQSWSVLSGGGEKERSLSAMNTVNNKLVDRKNRLIQLLDPPFDKSDMNPGYIKGYVPGVRENGGQYSHAAIWTVMAFAALGDSRTTWELFDMVNPVNHGRTAAEVATYKVEPYVMAADVYKVPSHLGRGGWTWYTGSAGWAYQAIIRALLGLGVENNKLIITPCVPEQWESFSIRYKYMSTIYNINVTPKPGDAAAAITIDGNAIEGQEIQLNDDGGEHQVEVQLGRSVTPLLI
jgi:cellobiose phosphorylase